MFKEEDDRTRFTDAAGKAGMRILRPGTSHRTDMTYCISAVGKFSVGDFSSKKNIKKFGVKR